MILEACKYIASNALVVFSSPAMMSQCLKVWRDKEIYCQMNMRKTVFQEDPNKGAS